MSTIVSTSSLYNFKCKSCMRLSLNENARISKELDSLSGDMRTWIDEYRAKELKQVNQKFYKFIGLFFRNHTILGKDSISNADIAQPEDGTSMEYLYDTVQATIDETVSQGASSDKPYTSILGMYKSVLNKIVTSSGCLLSLFMLELLMVVCLWFTFNSVYFICRLARAEKAVSGQQMFYSFTLILCLFAARFIRRKIETWEISFRNKIRNSLTIMVYYKLIISDLSFLESSDNNLLYRLFYWDLTEFSNSTPFFSKYMVWMMLMMILYLISVRFYQAISGLEFNAGLILLWFLLMTMITAKRAHRMTLYRRTLTREREVIYEWLYSYKEVLFNNLKERFKTKLLELKYYKTQIINSLTFSSTVFSFWMHNFHILSPIVVIVYLLLADYDKYQKGGVVSETDKVSRFLLPEIVATSSCTVTLIMLFSLRFWVNFEQWVRKKSAKTFFDNFFENDYTVQRALIRDATINIGEVDIQECNVYERDHYNNSQNFGALFSTPIGPPNAGVPEAVGTSQIAGQQESVSGRQPSNILASPEKMELKSQEAPGATTNLNKVNSKNNSRKSPVTITPLVPTKSTAEDSIEGMSFDSKSHSEPPIPSAPAFVDVIRQVAKDLSVRISSGDIVCIIQNTHTAAIGGFIRLLIGENIIVSGSIRFHGRVSYFSKETMSFLVGKTIRDNIIFGEDYDSERYEEVLEAIGINFDRYSGRDFYQIAERALNIKSDDRLNILLARFLYRDCNIYVAEDLFLDVDHGLMELLINRVVKTFLRGKTLIYVARHPQLVDLANLHIRFGSKYQYTITRPEKPIPCLEGQLRPEENGGPKPADKPVALHSRIKNSIFFENASYEEELAIHKKLQQQKKEIEKKTAEGNNIVDRLAFGIYLTNRRREEGKNLESNDIVNPNDLETFWRSLPFINSRFRAIIITVVSCTAFTQSLLLYTEYNLIVLACDPLTYEFRMTFKVMIVCVCCFFGAFIIRIGQNLAFGCMYAKTVNELHKMILECIFKGKYSWIKSMRFHDILAKTNEHLETLDTTLLVNIHEISEHLIACTVSLTVLGIIYSFLIPIVIVGLYIGLMYYFFRRLNPAFFRALAFTYFNQFKKDDFNFQLLSLIFGHRITGIIKNLNTRFLRLSDNLSRSDHLIRSDLRSLQMKLSNMMNLIVLAGFLLIFFMFRHCKWISFYEVGYMNYVFSIPVLVRTVLRLEQLFMCSYEFFVSSLNMYRVFNFIEAGKQNTERNSKPTKFFTRPDFDYTRSIYMKNASLTLGYKPILKKISLKVRPNQRVCILGFEGVGRSAIFDLLMGVRQRDSKNNSEINVFGVRVEDITSDEMRSAMYIVDKSPLLFEGTIRENIDPYGKHSDQKLIELLKELKIVRVLRRVILKNQLSLEKANVSEALRHKEDNIKIAIDEVRFSLPNGGQPRGSSFKSGKLAIPTNKIVPKLMVAQGVQSETNLGALGARINTFRKKSTKRLSRRSIDEDKGKQWVPTNVENTVRGAQSPETSERNLLQAGSPTFFEKNKASSTPFAAKDAKSTAIGQISPPTGTRAIVVAKKDPSAREGTEETPKNGQTVVGARKISANDRGATFDMSDSVRQKPQTKPVIIRRTTTVADKMQRNESSSSSDDQELSHLMDRDFPRRRLDDSIILGEGSQATKTVTPNLQEFLNMRVTFTGQNIEKPIRKLISFARAILQNPKLLMMYEEGINWGTSIGDSLAALKKWCPETTVLSITRSNRDVLNYDYAILMDGGMVIDQGEPMVMMTQESSQLYTYLRETDRVIFQLLKTEMQLRRSKPSVSHKNRVSTKTFEE